MVMNVARLKSGEISAVLSDIEACRKATEGFMLKVIIENCYLTDEEKKTACRIVKNAGANFVKTSTGFGPGSALPSDVRLLREVAGPSMGVKAAGGIRTLPRLSSCAWGRTGRG